MSNFYTAARIQPIEVKYGWLFIDSSSGVCARLFGKELENNLRPMEND